MNRIDDSDDAMPADVTVAIRRFAKLVERLRQAGCDADDVKYITGFFREVCLRRLTAKHKQKPATILDFVKPASN